VPAKLVHGPSNDSTVCQWNRLFLAEFRNNLPLSSLLFARRRNGFAPQRGPALTQRSGGKQNANKRKRLKNMIKRMLSLATAVAAVTVITAGAMAEEPKPFDRGDFEKAMAAGKTVLVDFDAGWCPVCKKQAEAIPEVMKQTKFQRVVVFKADYDSQKELKKQLKITHQSTLVLFKGKKEVGREQGITSTSAIGELLEKGL
jgi:thioredoxin 1